MTTDEKQTSHPSDDSQAHLKQHPTLRFFFRVIFFILLWWLLSAMMPFIPSPISAAKGLLSIVKSVTDSLYFAAKEESLKESAQKVRELATEQNDESESVINRANTHEVRLKKKYERYDSTIRAELKTLTTLPPVRGRIVNVLAIGSDARLGSSDLHADAIHLITISPDSGIMEIMSIPRDTYCDLGYPDTTSYNHITNARALGMESFLRHVEELCNRGKIKYYVEVGFSQVMGILELLGFKDPSQTLKFLRARKTLRSGDIQRSHNQAQFMKQSVIRKFDLLTGASGDLLLSAGLQFVSTNLIKDFCLGLIYSLKEKGFPNARSDAIRLRMLPIYKMRLAEMLPDSVTINSTLDKADKILADELDVRTVNVANLLRRKILKSIADSSRPARVITNLSRYYNQRAWMQIHNRKERIGLRDSLLFCLGSAYQKLGNNEKVKQIVDARSAENLLYEKMEESK